MKTAFAACIMVVGMLLAPPRAAAQDIFGQVAPAAVQIQAEGLDGSPDTVPRIIEILNAYGIDIGASPDDARGIVRAEREDRAGFGRADGLLLIAFQRRATCGELAQKADAAANLSRGLMFAAQLNTVGAGLTAASGAGLIFTGPLAFAGLVTGLSSAWAGQLSTAYRNQMRSQGCGINYQEAPWQSDRMPNDLAAPNRSGRTRPQWRVAFGYSRSL